MTEKDLEKFRSAWRHELEQTRGDKCKASNPGCKNRSESPTSESTESSNCFHFSLDDFDDVQIELKAKAGLNLKRKLRDLHSKENQEIQSACNQQEAARLGIDESLLGTPFELTARLLNGEHTDPNHSTSKIPKNHENNDEKPDEKNESLVEQLIADIDELTEVPFFDVNLPREIAVKIFRHLDLVDLCQCAQVSKSWKQTAEDEQLWADICHKLEYKLDVDTCQLNDWKGLVRQNILNERKLKSNWKNRVGESLELEYPIGGILTSVSACDDFVAAGFSSGIVKLWQPHDVDVAETILDNTEDADETSTDFAEHVCVSSHWTASGSSNGRVDIWDNNTGHKAVHTVKCPQRLQDLQLCSDCLVFAYGHHLQIVQTSKNTCWTNKFLVSTNTSFIKEFVTVDCQGSGVCVVTATYDELRLHSLLSECSISLHNHINESLTSLHASPSLILAAVSAKMGFTISNEIKLFVPDSARFLGNLHGHTFNITCMHLADDGKTLATGSCDRKIRVYDISQPRPQHILCGQAGVITRIHCDDWKVISGDELGTTSVWDLRMLNKLWEMYERHPVRYMYSDGSHLLTANIPRKHTSNEGDDDEHEIVKRKSNRGCIRLYDFSIGQESDHVPVNCHAEYSEPEAYSYNIRLETPYDSLLGHDNPNKNV